MEIQILPKNSLRIKGRHGSIGINPKSSSEQGNAAIYIGKDADTQNPTVGSDGILVINGPGEYEISGIKISGVRIKNDTVYSVTVDGVECMVGTIQAMANGQQKTKEHHVVIVDTNESIDAAFVTSVASNAVVFYGDQAAEVVNKLAKENVKHTAKYQVTADKLPSEMETVLLA